MIWLFLSHPGQHDQAGKTIGLPGYLSPLLVLQNFLWLKTLVGIAFIVDFDVIGVQHGIRAFADFLLRCASCGSDQD